MSEQRQRPGDFSQVARSIVKEATERKEDAEDAPEDERDEDESDDTSGSRKRAS